MSCIFNYFFRNATLKTPLFGLKGKTKWAKVVKVYDGDTIHVVFYLGFKLYRWKCRLLGIDTPEIKTKSKIEHSAAIKAKEKLSDLILNKIITIECNNFDKYGRLLITVYKSRVNINKFMVRQGYAYEYDGGTKKKFELTV